MEWNGYVYTYSSLAKAFNYVHSKYSTERRPLPYTHMYILLSVFLTYFNLKWKKCDF